MSSYLSIAAALFAGATGASQAHAQAQAPAQPQANVRADVVKTLDQNFGNGDVNNDGFLSRAEVQTMTGKVIQQLQGRVEQEFASLDKDKNGQISLAEFKAAGAARLAQTHNPEAMLQRLDSNKDGKVSPAEFRVPVLSAFDRVDANKDGRISPDEQKRATSR